MVPMEDKELVITTTMGRQHRNGRPRLVLEACAVLVSDPGPGSVPDPVPVPVPVPAPGPVPVPAPTLAHNRLAVTLATPGSVPVLPAFPKRNPGSIALDWGVRWVLQRG